MSSVVGFTAKERKHAYNTLNKQCAHALCLAITVYVPVLQILSRLIALFLKSSSGMIRVKNIFYGNVLSIHNECT